MRIDFHTHAFKDSIAAHAIHNLAETCGMTPNGGGTLGDLQQMRSQEGLDAVVLLNIATKPDSERVINGWAKEALVDGVYSFASVHPFSKDLEGIVEKIKQDGFPGVKLHPCYQHYFFDDPAAFPLYALLEELGLPVVVHAGFDPYSPTIVHAMPEACLKVHKEFPRLTLVLAHMGGFNHLEEALECLAGENVYLDTALCGGGLMPRELAEKMIRIHGADKVLLGSDYPWHMPGEEIAWLDSMDLSAREKDQILGENAARLLGLEK